MGKRMNALESRREAAVEAAILNALRERGIEIEGGIAGIGAIAITALDRFPEGTWPMGCNLNKTPDRLHPSVAYAFQAIDAAVFSGDSFHKDDTGLYLAAHAQRWSRAMRERRLETED